MPLIRIDNIGAVGIVTDVPGYELPPEAWTGGQNVRFKDNKVQKFLGHSAVFGTPTIAPYWLQPVYTPTQAYWIYAGLTKVYVTDMAAHYNITRQTASVDVDYAATALTRWSGGVLNGIAVLNNSVDDPQMWTPPSTSTKLQALSNWPASTTTQCLRPAFSNFLFALDVTETGTRYPQVLRWSHPASPGAVPSSWDYNDATKDAGRVPIADTPGFLLDLVMMGNLGILYKEDSTLGVQYVGGRTIFAFNPLFPELGLLARDCVKVFRGMHFMVTQDDIVIHNASAPKSILSGKRRIALFNSIDPAYKSTSFVVPNYGRSEMWFCYPEVGMTLPSRALVWNWETGTLGDRQLPTPTPFAALGIVNPSAASQTWDADSGTWDADPAAWDIRSYDPSTSSLLIANTSGPALYQGDQTNQFAGSSMTSYIERTGLAMIGRDRQGNPKVEPDVVKYVKRVLPRCTGGPINVYVGSQASQDAAVDWQGPFAFNPATDREVLCDVVGNFISVKFESTTSVAWELTGYELDVTIVGR